MSRPAGVGTRAGLVVAMLTASFAVFAQPATAATLGSAEHPAKGLGCEITRARVGDAQHRAVTLRNLLQEASGIQVNNVRGLNFYATTPGPASSSSWNSTTHPARTSSTTRPARQSSPTSCSARSGNTSPAWTSRRSPSASCSTSSASRKAPTSGSATARGTPRATRSCSCGHWSSAGWGSCGSPTAAVTDLPDEVRATIENPGPYDRAPELGADLTTFARPVDAAPGSYASVGPGAPAGCNPLACEDESNDGTQRWIGDMPRTIPGIVGRDG